MGRKSKQRENRQHSPKIKKDERRLPFRPQIGKLDPRISRIIFPLTQKDALSQAKQVYKNCRLLLSQNKYLENPLPTQKLEKYFLALHTEISSKSSVDKLLRAAAKVDREVERLAKAPMALITQIISRWDSGNKKD